MNVSNALLERAFTCFDCGTSLFSISASHYAEVCSLPTKNWQASVGNKLLPLGISHWEYPRHLNLGNGAKIRNPVLQTCQVEHFVNSGEDTLTRACHQDEILGTRIHFPGLEKVRSNGLSFAHNSSASPAALRARSEGLIAEGTETLTP